MPRFLLGLILALGVTSTPGASDTVPVNTEFDSGVKRVTLVELYTSEGCSSCPPADRWLSRLKSSPGLWTDFVPVAFHVDYWDYIGWKDRFAQPAFSQRQRRYAAIGRAATVYTPGFFRDGREWRNWRRQETPPGDDIEAGDLNIRVDGSRVDVRFEPLSADLAGPTINIAILGMNLNSEVTAGENDGRRLLHDFVVLDFVSLPLVGEDGVFSVSAPLDRKAGGDVQRAIAAWVTVGGRQDPIQAVGGFL